VIKSTTLLPRESGLSLKSVLGVAGLGLLVVAILAFPYLNRGGTIVELRGTVVAPFEWPNDGTVADSSYYMRVTLESGEEVRVQVPRGTAVVPGKTVLLASRKGRLGFTTYGFRRYAD
jgi:hypothetical protein